MSSRFCEVFRLFSPPLYPMASRNPPVTTAAGKGQSASLNYAVSWVLDERELAGVSEE